MWCKALIHDNATNNEVMGLEQLSMEIKLDLFEWKQYESSIILLTVRWYLKYCMSERGLDLSHTTIMRWVHEFGPEIDKRIRPYLRPTNYSYRTNETYIKVKDQWKYLYRAVDSMGKRLILCYLKIEIC
ncbi:IS6 family transposase [Paenibacillus sp. N3.4]|nr:IS6 family transposase [Paenibacillus sp. N3.4]